MRGVQGRVEVNAMRELMGLDLGLGCYFKVFLLLQGGSHPPHHLILFHVLRYRASSSSRLDSYPSRTWWNTQEGSANRSHWVGGA